MSSISSVTTPTPVTVSSAPGDNGSSSAGGVDFDDVLKQLYAIEDECDKAIGELTQKVEQLAKNGEASASTAPAQSTAPATALPSDALSSADIAKPGTAATPPNLIDLQQSPADPDSSAASIANYVKATQSYTKAQVMPDIASLLFATNS